MALIIDIKVVPQSGKSMLILDKSGLLKCFVKSAPEDGKANKEVIEILADVCSVTKKSVEIIAGLTSRKKRVAIDTTVTYDRLLTLIGTGSQQKIF